MTLEATDELIIRRAGNYERRLHRDVAPIFKDLAGQFLADPNEFNGWGVLGPFDNTNSQDLGNVGAAVNRLVGGYCFPFDVKLTRIYAWHQDNNADGAGLLAWGWRVGFQEKTAGSNDKTDTDLLREVTGAGATGVAPRDYNSTANQLTDITATSNFAPGNGFLADTAIPAGATVYFGIETPTAEATNRYVRIMSGYLQFERV